mmetsp:Transcript_103978/g.299389  ORF Transcript_103978/g.299389 Transcript_103978/m.299389 type:complete len:540 (+) Transcript_103978:849-2468(+)
MGVLHLAVVKMQGQLPDDHEVLALLSNSKKVKQLKENFHDDFQRHQANLFVRFLFCERGASKEYLEAYTPIQGAVDAIKIAKEAKQADEDEGCRMTPQEWAAIDPLIAEIMDEITCAGKAIGIEDTASLTKCLGRYYFKNGERDLGWSKRRVLVSFAATVYRFCSPLYENIDSFYALSGTLAFLGLYLRLAMGYDYEESFLPVLLSSLVPLIALPLNSKYSPYSTIGFKSILGDSGVLVIEPPVESYSSIYVKLSILAGVAYCILAGVVAINVASATAEGAVLAGLEETMLQWVVKLISYTVPVATVLYNSATEVSTTSTASMDFGGNKGLPIVGLATLKFILENAVSPNQYDANFVLSAMDQPVPFEHAFDEEDGKVKGEIVRTPVYLLKYIKKLKLHGMGTNDLRVAHRDLSRLRAWPWFLIKTNRTAVDLDLLREMLLEAGCVDLLSASMIDLAAYPETSGMTNHQAGIATVELIKAPFGSDRIFITGGGGGDWRRNGSTSLLLVAQLGLYMLIPFVMLFSYMASSFAGELQDTDN